MVALLMGLPTLARSAPSEQWIRVYALPTIVVTDSGEKAGRRLAFQLAQFDRSLRKRFVWMQPGDDPPVAVFASADEATVRSMAPDPTDGDRVDSLSSYFQMPTQHVGAIRLDLSGTGDPVRSPYLGFFRGRASYLIERSLGKRAPSWLSRGLATFLADTVVTGKEVLVGRMAAADGAAPSLPTQSAAEFFRETRGSDLKSDLQAGMFIHYLLVADGGKNAVALDTLLQKLAASEPAASLQPALLKVIALYSGFPKHLAARKSTPLKLPLDPAVVPSGFPVVPLSLAEALMLRAEILFELNRPVDTRNVLRQAKAADPTLARPLEIEAILYEREQRTTESRQAIEAAIKLGSKNAALYYRLAQLQWAPPTMMTKPVLQSVARTLEAACDIAPAEPNILAYLADAQGDLGLTGPALGHAERAVKSAPRDPYALLVLARAQWNAKKTDAAQLSARAAIGVAKPASQKQLAQQLLDFMARNKRAQATGAKPYLTQVGPPPSGAFGVTRAAGDAPGVGSGTNTLSLGPARAGSADASAISDCFANRDDTACARALPSLEGSCAEKQATSCVSLGSLYDGGFGVIRDRRRAAMAYRSACDLGDNPGCARLAVLEAQGLGVQRNTPRATKTLETLCGENIPDACIGLAQVLRLTGRAADRTRARTLLEAACAAGAAEACGLYAAH